MINLTARGAAKNYNNYVLDECMTLWGEPERVYVRNVEQLHVSSECN